MDNLEHYILNNTKPEEELMHRLERETYLRVINPRMISGHLQGKLLEMLVRMMHPRRVLEIGTFTGYSTLSIARGLDDGALLDTIEVDDELEDIAAKYFSASEYGCRIRQHIGSALDVVPQLGEVYDMVFIDGDKREYPAYYDMLLDGGYVRSGSILLADNILWYGKVAEKIAHNDKHTEAIVEFNRKVVEDERVDNVIVPIRDGINLIRVK
ncbi:MAG: O-methyltransferase [Rikenellaceae bacterium]|nr:O-methyltransferase [Rikenellaceae bacterium]